MSDCVHIAPYDPRWPDLYLLEARRVAAVFPHGGLIALEHIGSTAVPGLAAKPVIDLMGLVASLDGVRERLIGAIEGLGYAYWAANPAPDRLFFVRGLPPALRRTHHLHLVERRAELDRHILYRDALRGDAELTRAYEALKRELAHTHSDDREAYTQAKKAFIDAAVARALSSTGAPSSS